MDLFGNTKNDRDNEWENMPEFVSENKKPSQQITVSFRSFDDVKKFAKLLDLKVTPKTDGVWFPPKEPLTGFAYKSKLWGDEE